MYAKCKCGIHIPITVKDAKPFEEWHSQLEVQGFQPFRASDSLLSTLNSFIHVDSFQIRTTREILTHKLPT